MIKLTVNKPVKLFSSVREGKIHLNDFFLCNYFLFCVFLSPLISVVKEEKLPSNYVFCSFVQIMSISLFPSHMQHALKHHVAR